MPSDELRIDGKIVNLSYSTCAPHVRLNFLRYMRYHSVVRLLATVCLVALIVALALGSIGLWLAVFWDALAVLGCFLIVLGVFSGAVSVALMLFLNRIRARSATIFENAALLPGIVISSDPLEFVSMANMSAGGPGDWYAVKRLELGSLPSHSSAIGTRFPCVATFQYGDRSDVWGDFDPEPLSFGTGDRGMLDSRAEKIGEQRFRMLEMCVKKGIVPNKAGELRFLDSKRA